MKRNGSLEDCVWKRGLEFPRDFAAVCPTFLFEWCYYSSCFQRTCCCVPRRARWRVPVIQVSGRLRLADRLSCGVLGCCVLCRTGVPTKFGIDMVCLGEPGLTRSSKEGCTGPGRKRSRSKPPCRPVVGLRLWVDVAPWPWRDIETQSFMNASNLWNTRDWNNAIQPSIGLKTTTLKSTIPSRPFPKCLSNLILNNSRWWSVLKSVQSKYTCHVSRRF